MRKRTSELLSEYVSAARTAFVEQESRLQAAEQKRIDRLAASEKKHNDRAAAAQHRARQRVATETRRLKEKIAAGQRKRAELLERNRIKAAAKKARSEQLKEARLGRQRAAAVTLRARLQAIQDDYPLLTLVGIDDNPPQMFRVSLTCQDESTGIPTEQWSAAYRFFTPRGDKDVGVLFSPDRRFRSLEALIRHFERDVLRSVAEQLVLHEQRRRSVPNGYVASRKAQEKSRTIASDQPSAAKSARAASSAGGPWRSLAESNRDGMAAARRPVERLARKSPEKIVEMAQRGALSYTELLSIVSAQYGNFSREQMALIQRAFADQSPKGRSSPFVVHASTKGQ
jgi:hypothetical protein